MIPYYLYMYVDTGNFQQLFNYITGIDRCILFSFRIITGMQIPLAPYNTSLKFVINEMYWMLQI